MALAFLFVGPVPFITRSGFHQKFPLQLIQNRQAFHFDL
jgi:hypothetical protein